MSGGRRELSRGRDILRQQVWLYGGPAGSTPRLARRESTHHGPRRQKQSGGEHRPGKGEERGRPQRPGPGRSAANPLGEGVESRRRRRRQAEGGGESPRSHRPGSAPGPRRRPRRTPPLSIKGESAGLGRREELLRHSPAAAIRGKRGRACASYSLLRATPGGRDRPLLPPRPHPHPPLSQCLCEGLSC